MNRDQERVERIQTALRQASLDAVICGLPHHVLLLSGYWPVIGVSLAIATRDGHIGVLVPQDELELAQHGYANDVQTFRPASLTELRPTSQIVHDSLSQVARRLGLRPHSKIGYEDEESSVPVPYSALHTFGASIRELVQSAIPGAGLCGFGKVLSRLQSVLTSAELDRVRTACRIGGEAFAQGARTVRAGITEAQIAAAFQAGLMQEGKNSQTVARAGGWVWCMSGPNAAEASGAFARTRHRTVAPADLVLVHANSYANGFWTDMTRTFCIGEPDERKRSLYSAVLEAFGAAFDAIKPGVTGATVDRAARSVLEERGFGEAFKHGTGHGVGFGAISHWARPRLHPLSEDVLETGMVFNVEPAVYFEGCGGLRHCSMIAVTAHGAEVLTPFQSERADLICAE